MEGKEARVLSSGTNKLDLGVYLSETEAGVGVLPAQGSVSWYDDFFRILETRKVTKVDKEFLQNQNNLAKGNEAKLISGLKFLGLIEGDGNATESMNNLSVVGEKRKENFEGVVRHAYSLLFETVKLDVEKADPDTLINCFKTDYKMGSLTTAEQAARIFVFLAQKAGITLSQSLQDKVSASRDRAKAISPTPRQPRGRTKQGSLQIQEQEVIPEEAMARLTVKGMGYVDIKDQDTYEIAKSYLSVLSKKLGLAD